MSTLVLSFLDGSSSFLQITRPTIKAGISLQVTRTTIKACMSLNFCQIPSPITELAVLERSKNECIMM